MPSSIATSPSQCLGQLFMRLAALHPHAPAVLDVRGAILDFVTLVARMTALGERLANVGMTPDARVAVLAPAGPDLGVAVLGTMVFASCAPLNPASTDGELAAHCRDLEVRALVTTPATDARLRRLADVLGIPLIECPREAVSTSDISLAERAPQDIALVLHTSGTTAKPKQVPLSHANLLASMRHIGETLALTTDDRALTIMPLFHIHGLLAGLLAPLAAGGSVVCTPGLAVTDFFHWLTALRPTWYSAVPTMHQAILQGAGEMPGQIPSNLRLIRSSSAALAPAVLARLEGVFACPVLESYGMTEAAHQMASNPLPPTIRKPGSVGRAAGPAICIIDAAGTRLPADTRGEVAILGPNVFAGYHNRPEANAESFSNGWFRTGDEGYFDREGYLFLTGRLKEMINRGGEKITPREIDEALLSHPAVAQAAAYAVPHATLGEDLAAVVTLRPGQQVTSAALREFLFGTLADFKVPSEIRIADEIPKGPSGKIQRLALASILGSTRAGTAAPALPGPESIVAEIWADLLAIPLPGRHDNFFRLGGDSLLAMRVVARLRERLSVDLPPAAVFRHPTVAELAVFTETVRATGAQAPIPGRRGSGDTL